MLYPALLKEKEGATRAWLAAVWAWPFTRIFLSHTAPIVASNAREEFAKAFEWAGVPLPLDTKQGGPAPQ